MSPREAVAELRTAIHGVRAACGSDPSCKELLHRLDGVEDSLKEVSYTAEPDRVDHAKKLQGALSTAKEAVDSMFGDRSKSDGDEDDQPNNLKDAAAKARSVFAERRKASASNK